MAPSSPSRPRPTLALAVVLLVVTTGVAAVATAPAQARAPPQPVCGVCVSFAEPQSVGGAMVDATNSTMTIQVYENGSSHWTARVRLASGSDVLRNGTTRARALDDARLGLLDDPVTRRSHVDGDTLVVSYYVTDAAHRTLGVVRFDAFYASDPPPFVMGGEGSPYPGADRLVLVAPADYRVQGDHGASTNETTVVWHGDSHAQYAGDIDRHAVVSFTRRDAVLPGLRAWLAGLLDSF